MRQSILSINTIRVYLEFKNITLSKEIIKLSKAQKMVSPHPKKISSGHIDWNILKQIEDF